MRSGAVARVGDMEIPGESVAWIAGAQSLDLGAARDLAIRDALFAQAARRAGVPREAAAAIDRVLARQMLRELQEDARRQGAPTDAEVDEAVAPRWVELDRPEGFVTVHAVARYSEKADEAQRKRAEEVAREMRPAIERAVTAHRDIPAPAYDFRATAPPGDPLLEPIRQAAMSVPHEGVEIVVEELPPVAADGVTLTVPPGGFDPAFAAAAATLGVRGDVSPLVTSSFGVHVIVLTQRIPELRVPLEERRRLVAEEVIRRRARGALLKLQKSGASRVQLEQGTEALLSLVGAEP